MAFQLTRKYLEEQISDSEIALQKHKEGVKVHEIVMEGFRKELDKLPEEKNEENKKTGHHCEVKAWCSEINLRPKRRLST